MTTPTKTPTLSSASLPTVPQTPLEPTPKKRAGSRKATGAAKPAAVPPTSTDPLSAEPTLEPVTVKKGRRKVQPVYINAAGNPSPRSDAQQRLALRRTVRMFYDIQRLRLQTGGRMRPDPKSDNPIELHPVDLEILTNRCEALLREEKEALKDVQGQLRAIPFYVDVLSNKDLFKGVGPTMAGLMLAEFDIHREENVSQMWSFAGLAPQAANRCKRCSALVVPTEDNKYATHPASTDYNKCTLNPTKSTTKLIAVEDTFASGKSARPVKGEKLKYNSFLRSKLVGVLGPVLIKLRSPWAKFYYDYKHRKSQPQGGTGMPWGTGDAHRHQAAIRYMIKMLLLELHIRWREYLGLPVRKSYQEEYLGHTHVPRPSELLRTLPEIGATPDEDPDEIAAELDTMEA